MNAGDNCVTVSGVTALSPWTLAGDSNAPNVVVLREFGAASASGLPLLAVGTVAVVVVTGAAALAVRRSRWR